MQRKFRTSELAKALYQQCLQLKLKGEVRDQLERAALSIYLNLVEGNARFGRKDQVRFFNIAQGSLREVQALLDLFDAKRELETADKVGASLHCLIRSLTG